MIRVAAFTKYDRLAASTRQRVLQYEPFLRAAGMQVSHHPLLDADYVRSLATGERVSQFSVARAYVRRLGELVRLGAADIIWIYAELFPYLPAAFERLAFASGKPVAYDFDDAFFHQYDDSPKLAVRALLAGKLRPLIAGAAVCCCGNEYLRAYAEGLNANTLILPTVVDTNLYRPGPGRQPDERQVIGWIGSPSTWPYVRPLLPILRDLCAATGARFRVVGAGAGALNDGFEGLELIEWSEATEIAEVQAMDIGIMPVPDEPWARGKSGYKLIQYGACGLPVVASPVGVNSAIVEDGMTGLLAASPEQWRDALARLLASPELRRRMGEAGRQRIENHYSLAVHAPRLVELFRSISGFRNG